MLCCQGLLHEMKEESKQQNVVENLKMLYLPLENIFFCNVFLIYLFIFRKIRMKEVMSNNSTTSISQARKAVEQLKMEAYLDRIKVSKAAADLLAYCDAHMGEDPLIMPVPTSENPFREKKLLCTIL
uniref:Guanine nucleotide-binding protein subunit gamma n=2 Tax=Anolis TaxID=28376 RepID=G1K9Q7_ANOCA|nr:PREDICTED: guanine nucleotide-binding protein G(I)/G(S)/G(O) subunit gamma-4 [Anolis carolinensis]|eukprot:XP_003215853.2 PREDICTED: guanine nucleotide-binding protein G(I)/G(S)/G(O) subunit gamma-4 [Anolis carolinensis]